MVSKSEGNGIGEAKKYNWRKDLERTRYVDVQDDAQNYSVGIILDRTAATNCLSIGYDNWGEKYNEVIPVDSDRLTSIRRHTVGHTGAIRTSQRPYFVYEEAVVGEAREKVESLILTNLQCLDPFEFTHFVRAELFILLDSLITSNFDLKDFGGGVVAEKEMKDILGLINLYCQLYCRWLELMPQYFTAYLECDQQPNMYMVSLPCAIAAAGPEFGELLKHFFGLHPERMSYCYKQYEKLKCNPAKKFEEFVLSRISENKGFTLIEDLFMKGGPIKLLLEVIHPFLWLNETKKKEPMKGFASMITGKLVERIKKVRVEELKNVNDEVMEKLRSTLKMLPSTKSNPHGILIGFCIECIRSPFITAKLTGISTLCKCLVEKDSTISMKELAAKLSESKLIESVFNESAHEEIIGRSQQLIHLMLLHGCFSDRHALDIWKCCRSKNEDISSKSFSLLEILLPTLKRAALNLILQEIRKIKADEYDERLVHYLVSHTNRGIAMSRENGAKEETYDLSIFWGLIFESKHAESMKRRCLEQFCGMLKSEKKLSEVFIGMAAENIAKARDIERSMQFLVVLEFSVVFAGNQKRFEEFVESHKLVDSAVASCKKLHANVEKLLKVNPDMLKGLMEYAPAQMQGMSFGVLARLYLSFLQQVYLGGQSMESCRTVVRELWETYCRCKFSTEHSDIFWGAMKAEGRKSIGFFKTKAQAQDFFMEYFDNPELSAVSLSTLSSVECVIQYFEFLNQESHAEPIDKMTGIKLLWSVYLKSTHSQIRSLLASYLVGKYYSYITSNSQYTIKKETQIEEFLVTRLTVEKFTPVEHRNSFALLNAFMDKFERDDYERNLDNKLYSTPPLEKLYFVLPDTVEPIDMPFPRHLSTKHLLKKLSNLMQVPVGQISIHDFYNSDCTHMDIPQLSQKYKLYIKLKEEKAKLKEKPREILVRNPALFDRVIETLAHDSSEVVDEAWAFIEKLPVNQELMAKLLMLEIREGTEEEWVEYLGLKEVRDQPKLAYSLSLLWKHLAEEAKSRESFKSIQSVFAEKKGTDFLLAVFIRNFSAKPTKIGLKCSRYSLQILNMFWDTEAFRGLLGIVEKQKLLWQDVEEILKWTFDAELEKEVRGMLGQEERLELVEASLEFLCSLATLNEPMFVSRLLSESHFHLLEQGLFDSDGGMRARVEHWIVELCRRFPRADQKVLTILLNSSFEFALRDLTSSVQNFYTLIKELMRTASVETLDKIVTPKLLQSISDFISTKVFHLSDLVNYNLYGLMDTFAAILRTIPSVGRGYVEGMLPILTQTLFGFSPGMEKPIEKYTCKDSQIRAKAIPLLSEIIRKLGVEVDFIKGIRELHGMSKWRSYQMNDWTISPALAEPNAGGYVGLENQGATCYLNSVLQQLYSIECFRDRILSLNIGIPELTELAQIQKIFGILYEKEFSHFKPKDLCHVMNLEPNVQRDASEFLISLLDKLQEGLKGTDQHNLINDVFRIETSNEIQCLKCNRRSERGSTIYLLDLEIRNRSKIHESLAGLVKNETMQGDNAYFCERCQSKNTAERKETIKSLPNVLLLHLKRFDSSYEGNNTKLNTYCEFPFDLDLEEYTQNYMNKVNPRPGSRYRPVPKAYYQYRLKGVVIHSGTLDFGHYYSLIVDREKSREMGQELWMQFNDTLIQPYTLDLLKEDAYGYRAEYGPDCDTSKNAYIIVYERKQYFTREATRALERDDLDPEYVKTLLDEKRMEMSPTKLRRMISLTVAERLADEKRVFMCRQILFEPSYLQLILHMVEHTPDHPDIHSFAVLVFLTTAIRSELRELTIQFAQHLKSVHQKHETYACNFAMLFTHPRLITELIMSCPKGEARRFVVGVLKPAIRVLYQLEGRQVLNHLGGYSKEAPPRFLQLLNCFILQAANINQMSCGQFFEVLTHFASLSREVSLYMSKHFLAGATLETLEVSAIGNWSRMIPTMPTVTEEVKSPPLPFELVQSDPSISDLHSVKIYLQRQSPYLFEFVARVLQEYVQSPPASIPPDFEDLNLISQEQYFSSLYRCAVESRSSLRFFGEMLLSIALLNKGANSMVLLNLTLHKLSACDFPETNLILRVIQELLTTADVVLFHEALVHLLVEINKEFRRYDNYATCACYLDFVIRLCRCDPRFSSVLGGKAGMDEAREFMEEGLRWLGKNKALRDYDKVFKRSTKWVTKDNEALIRVSRKAGEERTKWLNAIKKMELEAARPWKDEVVYRSEELVLNSAYDVFLFAGKKWVRAELKEASEGLGRFVYTDARGVREEVWIDLESERVAYPGTRVDNPCHEEREELLRLFKQS